MPPPDISLLDTYRRRHEINTRYETMINEFKYQFQMSITLLRMELGVKIAVAESNRERELRDLEPLE